MTYDYAPETLALAREFGFHAVQVEMKNTHHARIPELVIARRSLFEAYRPCPRLLAAQTISRSEFETALRRKLEPLA